MARLDLGFDLRDALRAANQGLDASEKQRIETLDDREEDDSKPEAYAKASFQKSGR